MQDKVSKRNARNALFYKSLNFPKPQIFGPYNMPLNLQPTQPAERWNPREVPLKDVFRAVQLGLEGAMAEPRTQICGVVVIFDMKGLSFSQVMQFTPSFAKMAVDWIQSGNFDVKDESRSGRPAMDKTDAIFEKVEQDRHDSSYDIDDELGIDHKRVLIHLKKVRYAKEDCTPVRLKAVHIINQPYIFNMLFAIFKPFLREKLRSRIHFHGANTQSLLSHIDANALRSRHGGALPDPEVPGELLWKMLSYYEDDFQC
ncbi:Clavesin-2 [Eumeta japonica]|uniref:Clavesin-2 n=1 Tax=Eumeta variegata TaxID=151549 RepID=A0A4C1SXZ8_EUMVA|nr:Clavesin-2 [Eumeta japonica]